MAQRHAEMEGIPPTEAEDADLTVRAAGGDTGAFEELYRRHRPRPGGVGYAVTGNANDASDAVSEAFTRVFAALPAGRFPAEAPFRPYLMTATRNAAIDGLRRGGRLPAHRDRQPRPGHLERSTPAETVDRRARRVAGRRPRS